jgi:hypothetical protein
MPIKYLENIGRAKSFFDTKQETGLMTVMKSFATMQIELSKKALTQGSPSHKATGSLAQSIGFKININETISLDFLMNDYWDFINQGVNGLQNSFGSAYSFKSLNPSPEMVDSFVGTSGLDGWIRAKNIQDIVYTDKDGNQVVKQLITDADFRSAAYVFARGVKKNGILGNHFIDNVFNEKALEKFESEIIKAIENIL